MTQCDCFDETIFERQEPILLFRRSVQPTPFNRTEFVIRQNAVAIVLLKESEFASEPASFLAFRQQLQSFNQFTNCYRTEETLAMVLLQPVDDIGARSLFRELTNGVCVEQVGQSSKSRAAARSGVIASPDKASRLSARVA